MLNRIHIDTEGIEEPSIVAAIEDEIRNLFRERMLPGSWRVLVRPSHVSGRWDVNIQGLDARHTLSIAVPANLLPQLVPLRLYQSLDQLCSARLDAIREREASRHSVLNEGSMVDGVMR